MEADDVEDEDFFGAIAASGARVLLIGRRGLVALGAPVMTSDYDLWVHIDDIERLNGSLAALELFPNRTPEEARGRGRYVIEGAAHVDVMVARSQSTKDDGTPLAFEDAWRRRQTLPIGGATVCLPSLEDYILTKRWALRARDVTDIVFLEALRAKREESS